MRQINGLENIRQQHPDRLNAARFAELLLQDLQNCHCTIYGCIGQDQKILLAQLKLLPDSLNYDSFDQRIDLIVAGPILRADCVPLTYILQGGQFSLSGRCSRIAKVCGVDLYLQRSYTGQVGDVARQSFALPVNALLKFMQ